MKYIISSIILLSVCILQSCSGVSHEPEIEYTGPWRIVFEEEFVQIHNDSRDFQNWYSEHLQYLYSSQFLVEGPEYHWEYPTITDTEQFYKISYCGKITWVMEIDKATESDIKTQLKRFESFTIIDKDETKYDNFTANYIKLADS